MQLHKPELKAGDILYNVRTKKTAKVTFIKVREDGDRMGDWIETDSDAYG